MTKTGADDRRAIRDLLDPAAYSVEAYEVIRSEVTADRVRDHFGSLGRGTVVRYEAPNVMALKFVMTEALELWLADGILPVMNRFTGERPADPE